MGGPNLQSQASFWLRGHVTNSKNLYLHFSNTYGHQTWQGVNLPLEDPTYLVRWPFNQVSRNKCKTLYLHFCNIYGHQTWQNSNLRWGTQPSKSRDPLIMWSRGKFKKLYLHFYSTYDHQTWLSGNVLSEDPTYLIP